MSNPPVSGRITRVAALLSVALAASWALAHVLITPEDLLVALAVGLLAGQRGSRATRFAVIALPLAWLAGGLMGARWSPLPSQLVVLTTATFALTGALVALDARLRDAAIIAIAIAAGLLHGLANGPTMTALAVGTGVRTRLR